MEQEPKINIPWESIEHLLKSQDWDSLNPEQREILAPFFNEREYAQARQLLVQSEVLFSEERAIVVPQKKRLNRMPYGIVAAAALALLISLGYLILPNQSNKIAYTKKEQNSVLEKDNTYALKSSRLNDEGDSGTPLPTHEESGPKMGESNLLAKQDQKTALEIESNEIPSLEEEVVSTNVAPAMGGALSEPDIAESVSDRKVSSESQTVPAMSAGIPMVRDSIWKNDTLWLLIKTPNGKDSLLPAFNSKGKVYTRR